jgi:hypothetical protein
MIERIRTEYDEPYHIDTKGRRVHKFIVKGTMGKQFVLLLEPNLSLVVDSGELVYEDEERKVFLYGYGVGSAKLSLENCKYEDPIELKQRVEKLEQVVAVARPFAALGSDAARLLSERLAELDGDADG